MDTTSASTCSSVPKIKICSSRYRCFPDVPKIKAILPIDYSFDRCDHCREFCNKYRTKKKKKIVSKISNTTI